MSDAKRYSSSGCRKFFKDPSSCVFVSVASLLCEAVIIFALDKTDVLLDVACAMGDEKAMELLSGALHGTGDAAEYSATVPTAPSVCLSQASRNVSKSVQQSWEELCKCVKGGEPNNGSGEGTNPTPTADVALWMPDATKHTPVPTLPAEDARTATFGDRGNFSGVRRLAVASFMGLVPNPLLLEVTEQTSELVLLILSILCTRGGDRKVGSGLLIPDVFCSSAGDRFVGSGDLADATLVSLPGLLEDAKRITLLPELKLRCCDGKLCIGLVRLLCRGVELDANKTGCRCLFGLGVIATPSLRITFRGCVLGDFDTALDVLACILGDKVGTAEMVAGCVRGDVIAPKDLGEMGATAEFLVTCALGEFVLVDALHGCSGNWTSGCCEAGCITG